jgi:hypothetical protein
MPSIVLTPSVSVPASVVSVSNVGSSVTYEQIKASLGDYAFGIRTIYFQANPLQLTKPLLFVRRNANGDKVFEPITQVYDPYQAQNSLFEDVSSKKFTLDGFTNIVTEILPFETAGLYFYTIQLSVSELNNGLTPFWDLVKENDLNDFFNDYVSKTEVIK